MCKRETRERKAKILRRKTGDFMLTLGGSPLGIEILAQPHATITCNLVGKLVAFYPIKMKISNKIFQSYGYIFLLRSSNRENIQNFTNNKLINHTKFHLYKSYEKLSKLNYKNINT